MLCPINGFSPYQVGNNILQNVISGLPQVNIPRGSVDSFNVSDITRLISENAAANLLPATDPPLNIEIETPSGRNIFPNGDVSVPSAAIIPNSDLTGTAYNTECPYDIAIMNNNFCGELLV